MLTRIIMLVFVCLIALCTASTVINRFYGVDQVRICAYISAWDMRV